MSSGVVHGRFLFEDLANPGDLLQRGVLLALHELVLELLQLLGLVGVLDVFRLYDLLRPLVHDLLEELGQLLLGLRVGVAGGVCLGADGGPVQDSTGHGPQVVADALGFANSGFGRRRLKCAGGQDWNRGPGTLLLPCASIGA